MTRNNLFLKRLLIFTDEGEIAYDEKFHKGINIIRGDNSSGKSTITHFIFYVLGGAFSNFVLEAKKCSSVYAEVEVNNSIFTIKRYLEKDDNNNINSKSSLYFFWGLLDESLNPSQNKTWQKYPYSTTTNKRSFSSELFDILNIPSVKGDNNITIHQLLRLMYIDQESPTSSLFYYENFDSQLTRETVADLLMGVYNEELYENKKRLLIVEKEFESAKNEIKITKQFFPDSLMLNPHHIKATIDSKESTINDLEEEIISIRKEIQNVNYTQKTKLKFQELKEKTIIQRKVVVELLEEIKQINNEIEDSEYFIEALKNKRKAINYSIETRDFFGELKLEYCPECLTKISDNTDSSKCKLCKESIDKSFGINKARRLEQEINFQIKESEKLLKINHESLLKLKSRYKSETIKLSHLQKQVNVSLKDVKSVKEEKLDSLYTEKGYTEGEIQQYRKMLEHAEFYENLLKEKENLGKEMNYLRSSISATEKAQTTIKEKMNSIIKEEGLYILNNDLERQDEFIYANEFFIDFANNIAFLSNKYSRYSASSNFYLKVAARFSLFLASISFDQMRFPRFIFADNMEDKGIEIERAQNLQKILIERLQKYPIDSFQMIYTTSYITDDLDKSSYVVGEKYTKNNPSLKNVNP